MYFTLYYATDLFHGLMVKCVKPLFEELKKGGQVRYVFFYRSNFRGENLILNLELSSDVGQNEAEELKNKVLSHAEAFFEHHGVSSEEETNPYASLKLFKNRPKNTVEFEELSNEEVDQYHHIEQHQIVAQRVSEIVLELYANFPNWGVESSMLSSIMMKLACGFVYSQGECLGVLTSFLNSTYELVISFENLESIEWAKQTSARLFEERKEYLISFVGEKLGAMEGGRHGNAFEMQPWHQLVGELYEYQKNQQQAGDKKTVASLLSFVDNQLGLDGPYVQVVYLLLLKTLKSLEIRDYSQKEN